MLQLNKLYIGENGRRLGDRIRDHFYDIRKNDLSKPVFLLVILFLILLRSVFLSSTAVTIL